MTATVHYLAGINRHETAVLELHSRTRWSGERKTKNKQQKEKSAFASERAAKDEPDDELNQKKRETNFTSYRTATQWKTQ